MLMSLGGYTSYVRISEYSINGGYRENSDIAYVRGEMELEGKLKEFNYKGLNDKDIQELNCRVIVQIVFTKKQEPDWDIEDTDKHYIGTIHLSDRRNDEYDDADYQSVVNLSLPLSMFQTILSMEGKYIKLETIHEIIQNPTHEQKQDNIAALVKRVYFSSSGKEIELTKKRKSWFG